MSPLRGSYDGQQALEVEVRDRRYWIWAGCVAGKPESPLNLVANNHDRNVQHVICAVDARKGRVALLTLREFCVNELCIVMHSSAKLSNGRPGNLLKNKAKERPPPN